MNELEELRYYMLYYIKHITPTLLLKTEYADGRVLYGDWPYRKDWVVKKQSLTIHEIKSGLTFEKFRTSPDKEELIFRTCTTEELAKFKSINR